MHQYTSMLVCVIFCAKLCEAWMKYKGCESETKLCEAWMKYKGCESETKLCEAWMKYKGCESMKKMAPSFDNGLVTIKPNLFREVAQLGSISRLSKKSKMEGFIVGGVDADIQMFPHTAQIARKRTTTFCGGSVISDRVILTAAHCLVHQGVVINPKRLVVYLGSDIRDSGLKYTVSEILIHPGYNSDPVYNYFYDIALMLLSENIEFSNKVKKGVIISNNSWRNTRYSMSIAGFGATSSQIKGSLPLHLKMTRMKYIDSKVCNRSQTGDGSVMPVPNHMFCLKADKWTSDCFGDSGSSVNWRIYIVGIVAIGRDVSCGSETMPSMYTDVTYFKDWINQSITLLESPHNTESTEQIINQQ